ncbi:GDSL esterase/lipase [Corchorus olitorius]|uniref:GDSL esterase/lipase n=1 Tax=Corchorus olitorius TaxID=93759 RepID=A0A1R3H5E5_9ROSI|nr:GDSL esterase/lipase [Corchorus olitorius]
MAAERVGIRDFVNIPSFAMAKDQNESDVNFVTKGVNYASGWAGIRDETGPRMSLHEDGARKFAVWGIERLGCTPYVIKVYGPNFWSGHIPDPGKTRCRIGTDTIIPKLGIEALP